jgi:nucleotide-binding universal stress UspA family protein
MPEAPMFTQILTALDGSEFGERALAYTRDLAKTIGARVSLLSVVLAPDSATPSESQGDQGKRWLAYLDEQAAALREAGVADVETLVRFGEPALMITEAARELRADLVVMSTQGLGADGRYALGSVALTVLMTAPCPLLMVRINKPEPPRSPAEERWQGEGGANVG